MLRLFVCGALVVVYGDLLKNKKTLRHGETLMSPTHTAILSRNWIGGGGGGVSSAEKKAQTLTELSVTLHIDICADRILNILLNPLY